MAKYRVDVKLKCRVFTLIEKMHKIGLVNILSSVNELESAVANVARSVLERVWQESVMVRRAVSSFSFPLLFRPGAQALPPTTFASELNRTVSSTTGHQRRHEGNCPSPSLACPSPCREPVTVSLTEWPATAHQMKRRMRKPLLKW